MSGVSPVLTNWCFEPALTMTQSPAWSREVKIERTSGSRAARKETGRVTHLDVAGLAVDDRLADAAGERQDLVDLGGKKTKKNQLEPSGKTNATEKMGGTV